MTIELNIKEICEKNKTTQLEQFPILLNKTREEFIQKCQSEQKKSTESFNKFRKFISDFTKDISQLRKQTYSGETTGSTNADILFAHPERLMKILVNNLTNFKKTGLASTEFNNYILVRNASIEAKKLK